MCGILFSVSLIISGEEASQNSYVIANLQLDYFKPAQHVESDRKRCSDLILRLWHFLCLLKPQPGIVLPVIVDLFEFALFCLKRFILCTLVIREISGHFYSLTWSIGLAQVADKYLWILAMPWPSSPVVGVSTSLVPRQQQLHGGIVSET